MEEVTVSGAVQKLHEALVQLSIEGRPEARAVALAIGAINTLSAALGEAQEKAAGPPPEVTE